MPMVMLHCTKGSRGWLKTSNEEGRPRGTAFLVRERCWKYGLLHHDPSRDHLASADHAVEVDARRNRARVPLHLAVHAFM